MVFDVLYTLVTLYFFVCLFLQFNGSFVLNQLNIIQCSSHSIYTTLFSLPASDFIPARLISSFPFSTGVLHCVTA